MTSDPWKLSEVLLTLGLIVVCFAVWSRVPEIKVSSKTLETYNLSDSRAPSWTNNIGLTIHVTRANEDPELSAYRALFENFEAYVVNVNIAGTNYPTMIDLPYERMSLTEGTANSYRVANREVSAGTKDPKLRQLLETFDWSIVNNTFAKQGRMEKGLLLFKRTVSSPGGRVVHLNLYHHPYKQVDLAFPFVD
ncbi:MAG TPA: hypothetical protein VFS76_13370 [Pyrinomonadaceae bacterium]|nr:hypothetical protein [Pyrinomonadaceae bacterium]